MLKKIKRLLDKNYKAVKKYILILLVDAIFHGFIYMIMFFSLLDLVNDTFTKQKILIYTGGMVLMSILRYITTFIGYSGNQIAGARSIADLRIRMGDHVRLLNMGYFHKNNIGNITNIVTNDLNDFEMWITHLLPDLLKYAILVLYLSFVVIWVNPILGAIQVGTLAVVLPLALIAGKKVKTAGGEAKQVRSRMISRIIEYVRGIEVFKSYNMMGTRFKKMNKEMKNLKKVSIKLELVGIPYITFIILAVSISFPILLLVALNMYFHQTIDMVGLITFVVVSLALVSVNRSFCMVLVESMYFMLSIDKLISVLDIPVISYETKEIEFSNHDIEFKNVDFEYIKDKPALKNVSFHAKSGTTTALVGASGSGKSTVLTLLARFWDVEKGEITIGGVDIKTVYPDTLLQSISMVFQQVYLLNATVFDNIQMGNEKIGKKEVEEACKIAHCHEFITEMNEGYQSIIEEGGDTLSGGEKQRISIARAIIKQAPIVLLDEATASLDVDNEYKIRKSLAEITKDKTVLVIAHRLETIKSADNIIVFDQGHILEQGSHDELMKKKGRYHAMYTEMKAAKEFQIV